MATNIDEQFVEYVVKSLVNKPDAVSIARSIDDKGVLLELTVDAEDLGRVIGKRGATAQSLRTLLRALGTKNEARYNLKIVDVDRPESERGTRQTQAPAAVLDDAIDDVVADDPIAAADDDEGSETVADIVTDVANDEADETPVEDDKLARTRRELADLDDLDI